MCYENGGRRTLGTLCTLGKHNVVLILRLRMLIHSSLGLFPTVRLTKQVMMDMYRMMTWHKKISAV